MKIRCRQCDICGVQMGSYDLQFWIRPKVKVLWGVPLIGMRRMDICNECFAKMEVYIQHPELIKQKEDS